MTPTAQSLSTLSLSSGDLIADRRFEWARDCEAKGDLAGAADLLVQALELVPGYASAWFTLGELRDKTGNRDGAIDAFRRARAADPADRHGAALHLARLGADAAGGMPEAYVRALFDHYAPAFDRALLDGLDYRAPQVLLAAVEDACRGLGRASYFGSVLDLGCGTGLAGAVFRSFAGRLAGVDLSSGMIAQARAKGLYDRLDTLDAMQFLDAAIASNEKYDLVVAADVLMYFPDVTPVIAAAGKVLAAGGILAFTTETHEGSGVVLRETLRYAHAADHVSAAVAAAGLSLLDLREISTRTEKKSPVPGLVVVAQSPASNSPRSGGIAAP